MWHPIWYLPATCGYGALELWSVAVKTRCKFKIHVRYWRCSTKQNVRNSSVILFILIAWQVVLFWIYWVVFIFFFRMTTITFRIGQGAHAIFLLGSADLEVRYCIACWIMKRCTRNTFLVLSAIPRAERVHQQGGIKSTWWQCARVLEHVIKAYVYNCRIVQLNFSMNGSKGDVGAAQLELQGSFLL